MEVVATRARISAGGPGWHRLTARLARQEAARNRRHAQFKIYVIYLFATVKRWLDPADGHPARRCGSLNCPASPQAGDTA
jgi:hypothetical protein